MALTSTAMRDMRWEAAKQAAVTWTKPQVNAVFQAIEDVFQSAALRTSLNNAINAATSPLVLTTDQKTTLVKAALAKIVERWA